MKGGRIASTLKLDFDSSGGGVDTFSFASAQLDTVRRRVVAAALGHLLHGVNDALGVGAGNLNLAQEAGASDRCDRHCLEEALRGCVETADHVVRPRRERPAHRAAVTEEKSLRE